MPRYLVSGAIVQDISVEVEADNEQEAIDKADMMPRNSVVVWDTTKLWDDAEVIHNEVW